MITRRSLFGLLSALPFAKRLPSPSDSVGLPGNPAIPSISSREKREFVMHALATTDDEKLRRWFGLSQEEAMDLYRQNYMNDFDKRWMPQIALEERNNVAA